MPGLFEDLIPTATAERPIRPGQPAESGLFDDLIPKEKTRTAPAGPDLVTRLSREADKPPLQRAKQFALGVARPIQSVLPPVQLYRLYLLKNAKDELAKGNPEPARKILASQEAERQAVQDYPAARFGGGLAGATAPFLAGATATRAMLGAGLNKMISALPLAQRALVAGAELAPTAGVLGAAERGQQAFTEGVPTTAKDIAKAGAVSAAIAVPLGAAGEVVSTAGRAINRKAFQSTLKIIEDEFKKQNPAASQDLVESFRAFIRKGAAQKGIDPQKGPGLIRSFLIRRRIARRFREGQDLRHPAGQAKPPPEPPRLAGPAPVKSVTVPARQRQEFASAGERLGFEAKITPVGQGMVRVDYFMRGRGEGPSLLREGKAYPPSKVIQVVSSEEARKNPKGIVFHGTSAEKFSGFQEGRISYFSESRQYAEKFGEGGQVISARINLKNPLDLRPLGNRKITPRSFISFLKSKGVSIDQEQKNSILRIGEDKPWFFMRSLGSELAPSIQKSGYDGFAQFESVGPNENRVSVFGVLGEGVGPRLRFKVIDPEGNVYDEFETRELAEASARDAGKGFTIRDGAAEPKQSGQQEFKYGILPKREANDHVPAKPKAEQAKAVSLRPLGARGGKVSYPGAGPGIALRSRFVQTGKIHIPRTRIRSPDDVAFLLQELTNKAQENVHVIAIKDGRPVALIHTGIGTLDMSLIHPMNVIAFPMQRKVDTVYVAHNHPSGNPSASPEDLTLTRRLAQVFDDIPGINFAGHVIIEGGKYGFIDKNGNPSVSDVPQLEAGGKTVGIFEKQVVRKTEPVSGELTPVEAARYVRDLVSKESQLMMIALDRRFRAVGNFPMERMVSPYLSVSQILRRLNLVNSNDFILAFTPDMALSQEDILVIEKSMKTAGVRIVDVLQVEAGKVSRPVSVSGIEPQESILSERKPSYEEAERRAISGEGEPQKDIARLIRRADLKRAENRLARELHEKAKIMQESGEELFKVIRQKGGIRPYAGGHEAEEWRAIPRHLINRRVSSTQFALEQQERQRRGLKPSRGVGMPPDEMADSLKDAGWPFESDSDLMQAIIAVGSIKKLTIKEFLPQARAMIEENADELIRSKILSAPGISNVKARIRRIGREIRRTQASEMEKAAAVISAAKVANLTPNQLAIFAKAFLGKTGREQITSKNLEELSRAMVKTRFDLRTGEFKTVSRFVPRQPEITGQPPRIPRSRALVTTEFQDYQFNDLTEFQASAFSGLDPHRAARLVDRKEFGPTTLRVVKPMVRAEITKRRENIKIIEEFRKVSGNMRRKSEESRQVFGILEGTLPKEVPVNPKVRETAAWLRKTLDQLLLDVNSARASVGKPPVVRREGYITHIQNPSVWAQLRGAFSPTPDEKLVTLGDRARDYIRSKVPFFRFALRRKGGPFEEDAVAAFEAYLPAAMRVKHMTEPGRLAEVFIDQSLPPRARQYFRYYLDKVVHGRLGRLAGITPPTLRRMAIWVRTRFAKGMILGNVSSVLQQPFTLPATVGMTSPKAAAMAAHWMTHGSGIPFAESVSDMVRGRIFELDMNVKSLRSRWEDLTAAAFEGADRAMVIHAFLSGYIHAVEGGVTSIEQAVLEGDRVAQRSQAGFLESDLAPIFQDEVTSGFLQFQNTINGLFNYLKVDVGFPGSNPDKWRAAALFAGVYAIMAGIYDWLGLPHPDQLTDFIPGLSTMREGPPSTRMLGDLSTLSISKDPLERSRALRNIRNTAIALLGPGANQARKTYEGADAVARGGVFTKGGKLKYQISGPAETARALAFGPSQTKAGKAYYEGGANPESLESLLEKFYKSRDPQERERIRRIYEQQRRASRDVSRERRVKERQARRQQPAPARKSENPFADLIPAGR